MTAGCDVTRKIKRLNIISRREYFITVKFIVKAGVTVILILRNKGKELLLRVKVTISRGQNQYIK